MTDTQSLYDKAIEARDTIHISVILGFLEGQGYKIIKEGEFICEVVPPRELGIGTYKSKLDRDGYPIDQYQILLDAVDDIIYRLEQTINKLENNLSQSN
ncbi:MAG: hypothetical protein O4861_13315 [Trichodesmium sp. St16_bin4-tuft]|jgi:hypothetical protein|nr:hypothetical protein [Trichodesmium sp. St16_bin4-tuft]